MATSSQRDPFADIAEKISDDELEADYYAVLGITPEASGSEIQSAFRRLARLWHPDRFTAAPSALHERAERRMRALNRAYSVLGDPAKRYDYDRRRLHGDDEIVGLSGDLYSWNSWQRGAVRVTDVGEHASANPNGAGQLAGILAVVLAVALFGGVVSGGSASQGAGLVVFGAIALLLLIVGVSFFTPASPIARGVNHWMEAEPASTMNSGADATAWAPEPTQASADYETASPAHADYTDMDVSSREDDESIRNFERYVEEALASVPEMFQVEMGNVIVRVENEPDAETLRQMCVGPHGTLFGLYVGVPLTQRGAHEVNPEIITIFRAPIERYSFYDPERIREQTRRTVLHEIAHHFGMDHDAMPDWIK